MILAIDPGVAGAIVLTDCKTEFVFHEMPIVLNGKEKEIDFDKLRTIIQILGGSHVFLERSVSFGMGTKGAFNYGRGFAAVEIAIKLCGKPVTYVESFKWTKVMHEGISNDLKPKVKSDIAIKRLFPQFIPLIPCGKKGKLHEGVVDALLIAGYGARKI
jgi:hypothetical protein